MSKNLIFTREVSANITFTTRSLGMLLKRGMGNGEWEIEMGNENEKLIIFLH